MDPSLALTPALSRRERGPEADGARGRSRCLIALPLLLAGRLSAAPVVFWSSCPVKPGETAMLIGQDFGRQPVVEIGRMPDGPSATPSTKPPALPAGLQRAEVLQADDQCIKLVVPAAPAPGVFAVRVKAGNEGCTAWLNRPGPWWLQGDRGPGASPGGWLRVQGRCLAPGGKGPPVLLLRGPAERRIALKAQPYTARADLPRDLEPGTYQVFLHNGDGGAAGWSEPLSVEVAAVKPWPATTFNVRDFGADGNGTKDDTIAVKEALAKAAAAGGGVVFLPRGRYLVSEGLTIPRFTVLRGEKTGWTCLAFADFERPPPALLRGTNSFGVEDLTIYASRHLNVIQGDLGDRPDAGDVHLRRVRVRADAYRGHLEPKDADQRLRDSLKLSTGGGDTVQLGGAHVEIAGCDLYGSGRCLYLSRTRGGWVHDNTFYNGRWGWYCLSGSDGLILERNTIQGGDLMSTGGGLNCLDGSTCSQNVYYAENQLSLMHGWDREAMTSDAGGGAYCGAVGKAEGAVVTLAADPQTGGRDWAGAGLFILDGRGRGQYRRIVRIEGCDVTLDAPFQVPPDTSSWVTVTMLQRHYLFVGNRFSDAGVALQLYGMAIEDICADNHSVRTNGFHNFGMNYAGIQPSWYIQWLDNEVAEGNSYRSGHDNYLLSGEAHLGIFAFPPSADFSHALTVGCVARGNRLRNNAHLAIGGADPYNPSLAHPNVQDVVVEANRIGDSDLGIFVRRASRGVLLRGNTFRAVKEPQRDEVAMLRAAAERRAKLLADPGPLAEWRFEELRGGSVPDTTGHGFSASPAGKVELVEGRHGQGARLDGQSWLRLDEPELFNLQSLTLALWIKPDTVAGRHGLVGKRFAGTAAPFVFSLWDGGLEFEATDAEGKWSLNFRSPAVLKAGEWAHVAVVAEQGKGVTIYVNGSAVATKENALDKVGNGEPLILGREAWAGVNLVHEPCWYAGVMDDVRIWGRALSPDELTAEAAR
ncbi:MAG: hypothetical protein HYU66_28050 [Armatimonadetes bacterium]|nr:hypothetical protein [Armatimonadota bacterium]